VLLAMDDRDRASPRCEQGHYEVSQACAERVLFPAVRGTASDDLVVAPGFSCRHQIADFCDNRRSLHTAELLAMAEQCPPATST
jgi:hypothetical protein